MFEVTLTLANNAPLNLTPFLKRLYVRIGIHTPMEGMAAPGVCYLHLDNSDRRFTPNNTASPHYGLIVPNKSVEVKIDGVTVFVGRMRRLTLSSGQYAEREATMECEDLLSTLQATNIALPLQEDVRADQLIRVITARAFRQTLHSRPLQYLGTAQIAEDDTVTVDGVTYRFKETPVQPNDVKRLTTATTNPAQLRYLQLDYLMSAINGGQGEGEKYFAGTKQPKSFIAEWYNRGTTGWIRDRNPVRYYRLAETTGTEALDIGENKRNATYFGSPTLGVTHSPIYNEEPLTCLTTTLVYGQGVSIPPIDMRRRSFSLHVMVRPQTFATGFRSLFGWNNGVDFSTDSFFLMRVYPSGQLEVYFTASHAMYSATGAVALGSWNRLTVSFDYHTRAFKVWNWDALIINDTVPSHVNIVHEPQRMGLGWAVYYDGEHMPGDYAELALFLRSDLTGLANSSLPFPGLGIWLSAVTEGSWANTVPVTETSAALFIDSFAVILGADYPALSLETGIETFDIAADQWRGDSTNALTAIQEVVESERGMFWQAKDGTLVFKNRDYWNGRTLAAPVAASNDHHKSADGGYGMEDIYNRVVVSYTPRRTLASGVVAKMNSTIRAAGRWGTSNKPPEGANRFGITQDMPPHGTTVVKVPFVDLERGRITAAKNLRLPPEPFVDYTANEREDGTGVDYTAHPLHPDVLKFAVARSATDIEVTVENSALGTLFIKDFQLRGEAIVSYEPVRYIREDKASQAKYGVRELSVNLPLPAKQLYAESLAEYLIGRYLEPVYRLRRLNFENQRYLDTNVPIVSIEIGDVITVTDYQLMITDQKYLVTGISYALDAHRTLDVEFSVRPLQDVTFWLLGDATYGKLDETTRLGV
jgi:hypothetical protein